MAKAVVTRDTGEIVVGVPRLGIVPIENCKLISAAHIYITWVQIAMDKRFAVL